MKAFIGWIRRALRWVTWQFSTARAYQTRVVEETLPREIADKTIYIVQEEGFYEYASMLCPCGCRTVLHMNLIPDTRPVWSVTWHKDGTISLHPSVWRQKTCKSHFWFKRGRVQWCTSQ